MTSPDSIVGRRWARRYVEIGADVPLGGPRGGVPTQLAEV